MGKVGDLSKLHDKYFDQGFRVIGISSESKEKLAAEVVEKRKGTYWIASDPADRTFGGYCVGGGPIPRFYLVDAMGTVVGSSIPDETELEALLANAFDPALDRKLHDKLGKAKLRYEARAYGAAWKAAKRLRDDKDEAVAADAKFLCERVEACADFWKQLTGAQIKTSTPRVAYGRLLTLRNEFDGHAVGKWANREMGRIKNDKTVKEERKAWQKFETALKKELKADGKASALERARKEYDVLIADYPRARATVLAKERIEKLGAN